MPQPRVLVEQTCLICGHQWFPRSPDERPRLCPGCKSVRWDVGKRVPKGSVA